MAGPRSVVVLQFALSLRVGVTPAFLRQRLGALSGSLAVDLAAAVYAYVREQQLGYFPALDYFTDHPGLDQNLLSTFVEMTGDVRDHARREARRHLVPVFSQASVERVTSPAFTLPPVNLRQTDVLAALAHHYHPGVARLDLVVSSVERGQAVPVDGSKIAARRAVWSLRDYFQQVEVLDTRSLDTQ
jgi:hypothetical protein